MATPVFVAAGPTVHSEATTSLSGTSPPGVLPGDLLLAQLMIRSNVPVISAVPTNWALAIGPTRSAGSDACSLWTYWKLAVDTDIGGSTYTWTSNNAGPSNSVTILRFANTDQVTPINQSSATATASTVATTVTYAAVTTTVDGCLIVVHGGTGWDYPAQSAWTGGLVERWDTVTTNVSNPRAVWGASVIQVAAGDTGSFTSTPTPADPSTTQTIALAPGTGGADYIQLGTAG